MKTRLKQSAAALAVTTLTLALTGCVESGRSSATNETDAAQASDCPWEADDSITTTARIAWQAIPNADVVVKDLGLLEACMPNAEISWVQAASGGDVVKYYGSGDVDLGLMGSSPATIASSEPVVRDVDLAVVWIHDVIGEAESLVVRDPEVIDLAGLEGGRIGVPFSSTAHYSLLQALAEEGLDPATDVEVINLDPEKMPGAWQGDQIDAAWVWDPVQSQLLEDGGTRILSSADTAEAGRPTFDVGTADRTFVAENPEFMAQWAKAQDHAVGLIQDDPATAAESVAVVLGIDPADAEKQFAGLSYLRAQEQVDYLSRSFPKDLLTTAGFLLDQGGIEAVGTPEQYAEHVDAGPARSAVGG
ncbi:ABC transporter substrate-binding protein [Nocardioides sp. SOB77]|uniref:ABC transporter substrate-binding protein n=1 Tax=Nocardioides oceani TaxID=3058369 RepID=A0ABT8FHJ2_9ACTN|nr:ABC transporter substrate-binding protein [Nocardioides oceani]MDN4174009.1 ABC transporter substrate-binding protein [Nocardioides oceani]